jgi:hypothetical protein
MAMTPNASHAHVPQNSPRAVATRKVVGVAHSGFAIQTLGVPGASTITRAASSRRYAASASSTDSASASAVSSGAGGRPVATNVS